MIFAVALGALLAGGVGPREEGMVAGLEVAREVGEELWILALGVHFPNVGEVRIAVGGARRGRVEIHFTVGGGEVSVRRSGAIAIGTEWQESASLTV